ncbi:hypothetical protein [Asticcacaulis sp. BE141]|nr:hypothetical protein [Asticcacaulis sp. BE141]
MIRFADTGAAGWFAVIAFDHVDIRVMPNRVFVNATGCVRCELLLCTKVT